MDIYALYSYFSMKKGDFSEVMRYQRNVTSLAREVFGGEMNIEFLNRLNEQIQMAMQTRQIKDLFQLSEKAATIARKILKEPHEQEMLLATLNGYFDAC